jgi:hypothetical protein
MCLAMLIPRVWVENNSGDKTTLNKLVHACRCDMRHEPMQLCDTDHPAPFPPCVTCGTAHAPSTVCTMSVRRLPLCDLISKSLLPIAMWWPRVSSALSNMYPTNGTCRTFSRVRSDWSPLFGILTTMLLEPTSGNCSHARRAAAQACDW